MAAPHDPRRYGQLWPQHRVDAGLAALESLRELVVVSGGLAWHLLSPPGHPELKHAHDHKDLDLMVPPENVGVTVARLKADGFERVTTRYDRLPSEEDFRRYERGVEDGVHPAFRITVDFFVREVEALEMPSGFRIVRPDVLLGFYGDVHASGEAWAVRAASRLMARGARPEELVGRWELVFPEDLSTLPRDLARRAAGLLGGA